MKLSFLACAIAFASFVHVANAQSELISLEQVVALALEKNYDVRVFQNFASQRCSR